eukprot:scaffold5444_cov181-Ochromonas_danica.AAC.15
MARYHHRVGQQAFQRALSTLSTPSATLPPLYQFGGVHGSKSGASRIWRNKPLFRRDGDKIFKTGTEAVQLLNEEAHRRDEVSDTSHSHWNLLEAERSVTFRVAWLDDSGVARVNRGFRVQYSSALGPYEGGTAFTPRMTASEVKAAAFDTTFSNALASKTIGGAYGGADFDPTTKSDTEIQRFCQSYMTELSKYIGPETDYPSMGEGVGAAEIGYMYGQYKRINNHCGQIGKGLLWGGLPVHEQAQGLGIVHFTKLMLADKGLSLEGKRCLITGSNTTALAVAEKLLELGAIPISFSDASGHVHEPQGFDLPKIKTMQRIKQERGATVGRYIMASTSARFNDPEHVFSIPCDFVFACAPHDKIDEQDINQLASNGCKGVIEGCHQAMTPSAVVTNRKKGLLHGPYRATTIGASLVNGITIANQPFLAGETLESRVESAMNELYQEIKVTAKEFNARGDLMVGTNIAAFIRVANVMLVHGSV